MLLLGALAFSAIPLLPAYAQENTSLTLSIRDGEVYVNGERIAAEELPSSLVTDGIQAQYTFSGDVRPVVDIDGLFYVIEEDGIRVAEEADRNGAAGIMRRDASRHGGTTNGFHFSIGDGVGEISDFAAPHAAAMEKQARELHEQAAQFQELQSGLQEQFGDSRIQELYEAAHRLGQQAEEAAMAAGALPHIEIQHYLDGIQREDEDLYDRLLHEHEMERESIRLSNEIRSMGDDTERADRIDDLRQTLDEIFELKQANRRREIEQFENRLEELQARLEERERLREEIIDGRLRQLLQLRDDVNW